MEGSTPHDKRPLSLHDIQIGQRIWSHVDPEATWTVDKVDREEARFELYRLERSCRVTLVYAGLGAEDVFVSEWWQIAVAGPRAGARGRVFKPHTKGTP